MKITLSKIFNILGSRLARNIYLWAFMLYTVLSINYNNEKSNHHGFLKSEWYWGIIIIGIILQMALIYGNNFLLIPRFLAKKKTVKYFVYTSVFVFIVSLLYTFGLKTAKAYINVNAMQQMGFVSSPVTTDWDFRSFASDMETYLFGNVMWVFIFSMAWFMNDYSRQQKIAETANREKAETELHFLKSQLNPHFLFNTLNNLYALSLKQSETAPDAILKLSSILRYLLYESNTALASFEKEKEVMRAYIDLELLRLKDKDKLEFTITSDQPYLVPPLLWLPVLENIFKHGTRIIGDEHAVKFEYTIKENQLCIQSINTFKSTTNDMNQTGLGLELLRKRLNLLYPGKHVIESDVRGDEYITYLRIELAKHENTNRR